MAEKKARGGAVRGAAAGLIECLYRLLRYFTTSLRTEVPLVETTRT